jgi:Domain of unknown function (DUF4440)
MRNRTAFLLLLGIVTLLPACTVWREHTVNTWQDATGGEGLERSFWKDVKARRWDELQRHVASNYVSFTAEEGRLDRAAALAQLQQLRLDDYSLGDFQVELNGRTLVVTYTIAMRGSFNRQPVPSSPARMMTVWQQQKSEWVAIAHSVIGPQQK